MTGGGPKYEPLEEAALTADLVLPPRKQRIDEVLRHRTRSLAVVLDRLEDSFNMAAVLRTSEALGVQDVHVIKNPDVGFKPNQRVTQGCDKWLDVHRHDSAAQARAALKAAGYRIAVSAVTPDAVSLFDLDFTPKTALVFGNERFGVSADVLAMADTVFWLPMHGFTRSLNISAAVSASLTRAVSWRKERLGVEGDLAPEELEALRARFLKLSLKQRGRLFGSNP